MVSPDKISKEIENKIQKQTVTPPNEKEKESQKVGTTEDDHLKTLQRANETQKPILEEIVQPKFYQASGKRKRCHAYATLYPDGCGKITINGKALNDYFPIIAQRSKLLIPLLLTKHTSDVDITLNIYGGGITGILLNII